MRYLKLFEAFEAQALSKVIKFLTKKVGKESSNDFKDKLRNIMNIYDIPLDKIKESNIKYLSKKQAIKIDSTEDVDNRFGIYCIKFWFSLDKGFLGYTGVGNNKIDFEEWKQRYHGDRGGISDRNKPFSDNELEYIKTELGLTTGLLIPVDGDQFTYQELQLGDEVVGIWNEDGSEIDKLALAKIWRDGDQLWAIQDVSSGGGVYNDRLEFNGEMVSYRDWGRYSWSMDNVNYPADDHRKLHRYIRNDKPISIQGQEKEEKEESKEMSIYDFNLPVSRSGSLSDWGNTWSINSYETMDDSDFSIVFYIGDMLDPDKSEFYETPTDIKIQRVKSRQGATKLLSDSEIKSMNIKRYLQAVVAKMGIKKDISELQNLQNIIKNATCGEFALYSLYTDTPSLDYINDFSKQITNLLRAIDEDKEYYIDRISKIYKNSNDSKSGSNERYKQTMDVISKCDDEETKKFIGELMKISKYIQSYFESQNIQTVEDLRMVYYKLKSIRSLILDDEFRFTNYRDLISEIFYPSDAKRVCERLKSRREDIKDDEDYKKLKNIEKYIKSVLI